MRPDFAKEYNEFCVILARQGKGDEAIKAFAEAVRLDPGNEVAQYNLESVKREMAVRRKP